MIFTHRVETGPWTVTERAGRVKGGTEKGIDCCPERTHHEDMVERVLGLSREREPCRPFSFDMFSTVELTMEQRQKCWGIVIGQGFQKLDNTQ